MCVHFLPGAGATAAPRRRTALRWLPALSMIALCLLPVLVWAAPGGTPLPDVDVGKIGNQPVSLPLQTLLLMTAITLIPSMLLVLTAFTRIIIVLGLLRQALGTGQTPSNQVMLGLALFLTAMVMLPTWDKAWTGGMAPYLDGKIDFQTAWTLTTQPLRGFMLAQIRETGWAGQSEENDIGMNALAVPVFDLDGTLLASLALAAPVFRRSLDELIEFVPRLNETAALIAARFPR